MSRRTLCWAVALLCAAGGLQAQEIGTFKDGLDGWTFTLGEEFPGAEGNLWRTGTGVGAASLQGHFRLGGNYVAMVKELSSPKITGVALKLKAVNMRALCLRLTDASGQVFQFVKPLEKSDAWQTVELKIPAKCPDHWGGADDGVWRGSAKSIAILLDKNFLGESGAFTGTFVIEHVRCLPAANQAAQPNG